MNIIKKITLLFLVSLFLFISFSGTFLNNGFEKEESSLLEHSKITNNIKISFCIIQQAEKNNLPVELFTALIKVESGFYIYAVNYNKNGTIDRGLCQLNSRSFPDMPVDSFFDVRENIKAGAEYLRWCIDQSGNKKSGIICYNCGIKNFIENTVPEKTLIYAEKIEKNCFEIQSFLF